MRKHLFLYTLRENRQSSLWFRPLLIIVFMAVLAAGSIILDHQVRPPEFLITGPDNARAMMSAIASSTLTAITMVFSIIMVSLVLASQQYSPRILRNFMRDSTSQYVIGIFIGTFTYSLLVLDQIDDTPASGFVPGISVTVGLILALISIMVFTYFIHHVARSIHIGNIVETIARDTESLIARSYAVRRIQDEIEPTLMNEGRTTVLNMPCSGYIQAIDLPWLVRIAQENHLRVYVDRMIGKFGARDTPLLHIEASENVTENVKKAVLRVFEFGNERTLYQDVLFGIRQLEDIAIRAISPAVNDPTTAVNCLDYIASILVQLARYPDPSPYFYDDAGYLRAVIRQPSFEDFIENAFNQIRQYAASEVAVTLRMLEVLADIAQVTQEVKRRQIILDHASMIIRAADRSIIEPYDRQKINKRIERLAAILEQPARRFLLTITDPDLPRAAD